MKRYLFIFLLLIIPACFCRKSESSIMITIGKRAPNFKLQDQDLNWRELSEFRGKRVVLYFYPKDNTPGCTAEACSFRDSSTIYKENNIVVLGVSYDSPASHKKFQEKYHLPFILLSDETKEVAKLYGAYTSMLNYLFPKRITFLINENGIIIDILENIDVSSHADDILKHFNLKS